MVSKPKAVIYARKSSEQEDRQVLSIESQIRELTEVAERMGVEIDQVLTESHSAKAPGRPVFDEMINLIEAGKVQVVIAWLPDRLSRNSIDTGRLVYLFDGGKLLEIITQGQAFKNTPSDKFLLSLLCSQAKLENDNKSINVKRGLRAKVEKGHYPTVAPIGYLNNKYKDKGSKDIVIDPIRGPLIRRMFDLVLEGKAPLEVLQIANEEWGFRTRAGNKLAKSTMYRIFTAPFYYGQFEYPQGSGQFHTGSHEPMITVAEYGLIQKMLGRDGKPRRTRHNFAYSGLLKCGECGSGITVEEKVKRQKNGNVHTYIYYHCTKKKSVGRQSVCGQRCIEEKVLNAQISNLLASVTISQDFHQWAMTQLRLENAKESANSQCIVSAQQENYNATLRRIDRLIDMRASGEITEEEFRNKRVTLDKEKAGLLEKLGDADSRVDRWLEIADDAMKFIAEAPNRFIHGDSRAQARILSALGSNLILKDGILQVSVQKPLLIISKAFKLVSEQSEKLEPLNLGKPKQRTDTIADVSSMWLRTVGRVRTAIEAHPEYISIPRLTTVN